MSFRWEVDGQVIASRGVKSRILCRYQVNTSSSNRLRQFRWKRDGPTDNLAEEQPPSYRVEGQNTESVMPADGLTPWVFDMTIPGDHEIILGGNLAWVPQPNVETGNKLRVESHGRAVMISI